MLRLLHILGASLHPQKQPLRARCSPRPTHRNACTHVRIVAVPNGSCALVRSKVQMLCAALRRHVVDMRSNSRPSVACADTWWTYAPTLAHLWPVPTWWTCAPTLAYLWPVPTRGRHALQLSPISAALLHSHGVACTLRPIPFTTVSWRGMHHAASRQAAHRHGQRKGSELLARQMNQHATTTEPAHRQHITPCPSSSSS